MKKLLTLLIISACCASLQAQEVSRNGMTHHDVLKVAEIGTDSTLHILKSKPISRISALDYAISTPTVTIAKPKAHYNAVVYSRMPVKKLDGSDAMPVAPDQGAVQPNTPVLRVEIIDPLAKGK